jgi:hypothetical protein
METDVDEDDELDGEDGDSDGEDDELEEDVSNTYTKIADAEHAYGDACRAVRAARSALRAWTRAAAYAAYDTREAAGKSVTEVALRLAEERYGAEPPWMMLDGVATEEALRPLERALARYDAHNADIVAENAWISAYGAKHDAAVGAGTPTDDLNREFADFADDHAIAAVAAHSEQRKAFRADMTEFLEYYRLTEASARLDERIAAQADVTTATQHDVRAASTEYLSNVDITREFYLANLEAEMVRARERFNGAADRYVATAYKNARATKHPAADAVAYATATSIIAFASPFARKTWLAVPFDVFPVITNEASAAHTAADEAARAAERAALAWARYVDMVESHAESSASARRGVDATSELDALRAWSPSTWFASAEPPQRTHESMFAKFLAGRGPITPSVLSSARDERIQAYRETLKREEQEAEARQRRKKEAGIARIKGYLEGDDGVFLAHLVAWDHM